MTVYELWLPIVLVGVATHILSTLAWTVLPHHVPEWQRLPDEDALQDALVAQNATSGQFIFPMTRDMDEMKSEGFLAKQGKCNGMLVLWSGPVSMGAAIGKTLAFFLAAAFCIGYLASMALEAGATFMDVFQFTTTAALLTHCAGLFPGVFWFQRKIAMDLVDKVAYAVVTGFLFAALWPAAS